MKLVVATRSAHKMREIRQILSDVPGLELLDLDEAGVASDPAEDDVEAFDTFEENALAKALYFRERTGLPTVADDSGIAVDALGGAPGVRSKRFAPDEGLGVQARDDANNRYLVERLAGLEGDARSARYVCVAVLVRDDEGAPLVLRGEAPGLVLEEPRGRGGFGYDPYVLDPELGRSFAEMSAEEKNARSHRGKAFRALERALAERAAEEHPAEPAR